MGCFNLSGFFSHAPIIYKDRIGAIVCIVEYGKPGCPIGATGFGYHPIMAPVYGEYNDYGGIEKIDESYTTKLFKEVVGIDFIEFIDKNYRNSETTLLTKDNGNQFDSIPDYQQYLRKLIPGSELYHSEFSEDDELSEESRKEIEKADALLNDWLLKKETLSSIHIIYEHESVLKCLEKLGAKRTEWVEKEINELLKKAERPSILDNLKKLTSSEDINNLSSKDKELYDNLVKISEETMFSNFRYTATQHLSLGDCNDSSFDISLYTKNGYLEAVKNKESFAGIKEIYSIAHALDDCGAYFCASKEDSQETNAKKKAEVHKVITKILNNKKKKEAEWDEEEY